MRYGMNPHQAARVASERRALAVINGEPSLINYLDALNAWQLVREARDAIHCPLAASFKHLSPAGVATTGPVDDYLRETWGAPHLTDGSLTSAYVRARDADPKSSFGDVIAVSEPVDHELAEFLSRTVSDAIVAPGFAAGVVARLAKKKRGNFLVFEAEPTYVPPAWESREVYGMKFEQERDAAPITQALLGLRHALPVNVMRDALLSLVILRYTQSNAIALVKDGVSLGIGAGQQNRVDCVRLAAAKARIWWLRRHANVRKLRDVRAMTSNDRLNWQIRYAEGMMTSRQSREFAALFGVEAPNAVHESSWRESWMKDLTEVTLGSDGFLPFRDNVDYAAEVGVRTIIEPGGSIRTSEIRQAAQELGIRHMETGLRLFHH
jgi:phosphoribosylaminoimidazolecarboxamide formyltransferase/IMP cyclohydrolase